MEKQKGFLRGRRSRKGVYEGEKTKGCVGGRKMNGKGRGKVKEVKRGEWQTGGKAEMT